MRLLHEYMQGVPRGPFDETSRLQAGFTVDELQQLASSDQAEKSYA
jgi:uncharacterized ferritin-like protein (DUF455 family)